MPVKRILRARFILPALVFLIPLVIYSITLTAGFVYDDNAQVLDNPWIRDPGKIPTIFASSTMAFLKGHRANTYRPVFYLVYMAEYLVFGFRPWAWHLVNVVLHSMNALALYFLASIFFSRQKTATPDKDAPRPWAMAPFFIALIFALHPVNSEVVAWVGTIPELVYTLLVLCAFILYLLAEKTPSRALPYRLCSLVCFFVALFSKETAMALIIIIPLYEFIRLGTRCIKRWKVFLPYLVPAAIYISMRTYALGGMTQKSLIEMSFYEGLLNVLPLVARYMGKLLMPVGLSIVYNFEPVHSPVEVMFIIGVLAAAAFVALIYYLRKERAQVFFLLWILIPILPVLYMPILSVGGFADRYLYLSTIGFASFAGLLFSRVYEKPGNDKRPRVILTTAMALILILYSAGCIKRTFVWQNDYTLWSDTAIKSPESDMVLYNLGLALQNRGGPEDLDKALKLYEKTIRLNPDKEVAYYNSAIIYQKRKDYTKALKHYMASLWLAPLQPSTYHNIALIYHAQGRLSMAIDFYKQALKLDQKNKFSAYNNEASHYSLAIAYEDSGNFEMAMAQYREVLKLNPRNAEVHYSMGVIYEQMGRPEDALKEFQKTLAIDPDYGPAALKMR